MKKWEKVNKNAKINKDKLFKNIIFKPTKFQKIENKCIANTSSSKKTAIILFQRTPNNKTSTPYKNKNRNNNIKVYNFSKSNEKKSKTLNNTRNRKNKLINYTNIKSKNKKIIEDKNNLSKSNNSRNLKPKIKNKEQVKQKILQKKHYSPNIKTSNKTDKKKILTQKRNKTPIQNTNICLTNNNKSKEFPTFNDLLTTNYNFKTLYKDKLHNYLRKLKSNFKNKNKKDLISKDELFPLKANKSFNQQRNIKQSSKNKKNINKIHRRRQSNTQFEEGYNTFNNTCNHKKEFNSYSLYKTNHSIKINNKINKENKPRVDTMEYLDKIMNSVKTSNLTTSIGNKNKYYNNINNNDSFINVFRRKNNEKNKSKDGKNDIKKYIQVKKKLFKLSNIKKKKREKEEELKKYLQLYKLQENIFNSNNNTFYNTNSKIVKKQNIFDINEKSESNDINNKQNNNNNEFMSSIDSTIVDKNNFYQGIMDIQNIYSNNIVNHNIIINNYPDSNFDEKNNNKEKDNDILNRKIKKINSRNNYELNNNNRSSEINSNNKTNNTYKELKEEKIDQITFTYSSPIKEENVDEKNLNKDNINNIDIEKNNKQNEFQINELNEYSFKLNSSNESNEIKENNNDLNSLTTSKFFNSQILSENDRQNENNIIKEKEEKNENNIPSIEIPPSLHLLSENNSIEEHKDKKYLFTKEELDNYKEIFSSLFDYLKLITQRNALNDIISYGDMKYKYKIGFEIIVTLIKLAPFNIIRAIQQTQYYHFAFRQLFIPYITKSFRKLKSFCFYDKLFKTGEKIIKNIYKKIIIKKINKIKNNVKSNKLFDKTNIDVNNNSSNINSNIISIENITKSLNKNDKEIDLLSNEDISESKENDLIEWEGSILSEKQDNNEIKSNNNINKAENLEIPDLILNGEE